MASQIWYEWKDPHMYLMRTGGGTKKKNPRTLVGGLGGHKKKTSRILGFFLCPPGTNDFPESDRVQIWHKKKPKIRGLFFRAKTVIWGFFFVPPPVCLFLSEKDCCDDSPLPVSPTPPPAIRTRSCSHRHGAPPLAGKCRGRTFESVFSLFTACRKSESSRARPCRAHFSRRLERSL